MGEGHSQRAAYARRVCSSRTVGQRRNELLRLGFRGKSDGTRQSNGVETGALLNNSATRKTERPATTAVEAEFSKLNPQLPSRSGFAIGRHRTSGTIEPAPASPTPSYR